MADQRGRSRQTVRTAGLRIIVKDVPRLEPDGDGGGGGDLVIDSNAMAADADSLGRAAASVSSARDALNSAWQAGGGAFGPIEAAFGSCCRVWVDGLNTVAQLTQYAAQYTQDIANAFGSTDTQLAASATQMYAPSTLPKPGTHYKSPDTSNMA
jgi:uncharacterized protein YukE